MATTRPAPCRPFAPLAAAVAVALAGSARAASVDFVPVDAALPASSTAGVGLTITETRNSFRFTFTNPGDLGSSHLKIVFEAGLTGLIGAPVDIDADGATFTDRTAIMPRQPGTLQPADWEDTGALVGAYQADPVEGLRNTEPDELSIAFLKHGLSLGELLDALVTVGQRIGVVTHWGAGQRLAMVTALPEAPAPPPGPVPTPVPTPVAAALGLALLATQCQRRDRR